MTEQQRTKRIEFVKNLLEINGFVKHESFNISSLLVLIKSVGNLQYQVDITHVAVEFRVFPQKRNIIEHDQPLKPLRDFIKLSNSK